jgi:hypothetical protein
MQRTILALIVLTAGGACGSDAVVVARSQDAIASQLSNIASATTASGTSSLAPGTDVGTSANYNQVREVPTASHPNEPAGFTMVADNPFDEPVTPGWSLYEGGRLAESSDNLKIVTDATAPLSPSNVAAARFPRGFIGGSGPINLLRPIGAAEFYTHFALKVSDNWHGHSVGVKLFFIRNRQPAGEKGDIVFFIAGSGSNPLSFEVRTQNVVGGGVNYASNLAPAALTRGVWYDIEVHLMSDSSAGASDGQIHVWIYGVKTHQRTDVSLLRPGADRVQDVFQWNPTYGGGNQESVPEDQFQYVDHVYVSGK